MKKSISSLVKRWWRLVLIQSVIQNLHVIKGIMSTYEVKYSVLLTYVTLQKSSCFNLKKLAFGCLNILSLLNLKGQVEVALNHYCYLNFSIQKANLDTKLFMWKQLVYFNSVARTSTLLGVGVYFSPSFQNSTETSPISTPDSLTSQHEHKLFLKVKACLTYRNVSFS